MHFTPDADSARICRELLGCPRSTILDWLQSFDTVLFDCDGVLWLHNTAIAGSPAVIRALQAAGKRVFLVTNNSSKTRAQFAAKGEQLGYRVPAANICSTAALVAGYLRGLLAPEQMAYVIGSAGIVGELDALGVLHCGYGPDEGTTLAQLAAGEWQPDARVAAVIVGFDEHFGFAKLAKAATYLEREKCVFVATSIDQRSPIRGAVIPGTGAILRSVEEVAGRRAKVLGKPDPQVVEQLMREHGIVAERTLMVGDRCNTDIQLGLNCGFRTLLVGTGCHGLWEVSQLPAERVPDYYVPRLGDLLQFL